MHTDGTSISRASSSSTRPPRSPSPPSQTFHPSLISTPGDILGSAAAGAHYSGAKIFHRRSDVQRASLGAGGHSMELDERRTQVLDDLKELYCCRPTPEIFQRLWRKDAVFEDPLAHCKGLSEIASQWYAMPKIFSKSVTVATRVLSCTYQPNRIIYSQTQEYTVKVLGVKKTVKSIILVDLDEEDKIVRLEDQWNGEESPSSWGLGTLRRANGKVTSWLVRVPKDLRKSD